jgi:hypothetical protein
MLELQATITEKFDKLLDELIETGLFPIQSRHHEVRHNKLPQGNRMDKQESIIRKE